MGYGGGGALNPNSPPYRSGVQLVPEVSAPLIPLPYTFGVSPHTWGSHNGADPHPNPIAGGPDPDPGVPITATDGRGNKRKGGEGGGKKKPQNPTSFAPPPFLGGIWGGFGGDLGGIWGPIASRCPINALLGVPRGRLLPLYPPPKLL